MKTDDLIPVMTAVRASDGAVSVLPLLDTPLGLALYEGDTYTRIGQVRATQWEEEGRQGKMMKRSGFAWYYDTPEYGRESGRELTHKAATAALLAAGGYVQAPPNAANPGLFA